MDEVLAIQAAALIADNRRMRARLAGRLAINGKVVAQGTGAQIMGHPLRALAWLANLRAREGRPLRAGAFVSLGSIVETRWVRPGDHVVAEINHLGRVEATFIAAATAA